MSMRNLKRNVSEVEQHGRSAQGATGCDTRPWLTIEHVIATDCATTLILETSVGKPDRYDFLLLR